MHCAYHVRTVRHTEPRENAVKNLICPISPHRAKRGVVRTTATLIALLVILYAFTGSLWIIALLAVDFFIRGCTSLSHSPLSWLADQLVTRLHLSTQRVDKAPKIFAARVGLLFSLTILLVAPFQPIVALVVAGVLLTCALLEAILEFCVGCVVYTHIVLPWAGTPN